MSDTDPAMSEPLDERNDSTATTRYARVRTTLHGVGGLRVHRRVPLSLQVKAVALNQPEQLIIGRSADISHRGMFIKSEESLDVDNLIVAQICTPCGTGKFTARVVHSIEGLGFGVEFVAPLASHQRRLISQLVTMRACAPLPLRTIR